MERTRSSLLGRVRDLDDSSGWVEFDGLYRPLLVRYARNRGLGATDAEEIAQQCIEVIVEKIQRFKKRARFRSWLRRIVDNKVKQFIRDRRKRVAAGDEVLAELPCVRGGLDEIWEHQWELAHLAYCMRRLRADFADHTLQAFELYVIQSLPVADIAELLGMTPNQIYMAKSRVIKRIRERHTELTTALYGENR